MADVNVGLQEIFAMEGIASGQELYGRLKEHVLTCMLPRILPPDTALRENLNQYKVLLLYGLCSSVFLISSAIREIGDP